MSKYYSRKTVVDNIVFDSKKEAERYLELKMSERAGAITDLQRQVKFELLPKQTGERAVTYTVDFTYFCNRLKMPIAEEVKGFKTKDYIIKRKLFKHFHKNYLFKEI